jgi:hypothetical protein
MVLALQDVTLCAVTAVNHELTVWAMQECLKHCSFADVVLISDRPVEAPFRVELMPPFPDGTHYAPFVCRELTKYTPSPFNLLVQYDGYIVEPKAWSEQFYDYDYIGAKWPWHAENRRVGNSGFCLRSKRLLDILAETPLPPPGKFVDDEFICHTLRGHLENFYNIKIAPEPIADRFAYERHVPEGPSFGFHGLFNFWRHNDDATMERILDQIDRMYTPTRAYAEVVFQYFAARKFRVFCLWYKRLHDQIGAARLKAHCLTFVNEAPFVDQLIKTGDELCGFYFKDVARAANRHAGQET